MSKSLIPDKVRITALALPWLHGYSSWPEPGRSTLQTHPTGERDAAGLDSPCRPAYSNCRHSAVAECLQAAVFRIIHASRARSNSGGWKECKLTKNRGSFLDPRWPSLCCILRCATQHSEEHRRLARVERACRMRRRVHDPPKSVMSSFSNHRSGKSPFFAMPRVRSPTQCFTKAASSRKLRKRQCHPGKSYQSSLIPNCIWRG